MSYLNFFIKGVPAVAQYTRDVYPENHITYTDPVDFQGKIETEEKESTKILHVDNAFEITIPSTKVTVSCKSVWSKLQKNTKITAKVTLMGGLTALTAAIAMGLISSSLLIPAIAIGAIALAFFAFAVLAIKRSRQAKVELNKWDHSIDNLIDQCEQINHRLIAEKDMKDEIASAISNTFRIIDSQSGCLADVKINMAINYLALQVSTIWAKHSMELMEKISQSDVIEFLNTYTEKLPLIKDVIKILLSSWLR